MAKRYGGPHSPENTDSDQLSDRPPWLGKRRSQAGARVNLLFLAPLPIVWKAFTSEPVVMAQYLIALGLLILAAWMTREGIFAQEAYDARKVARRPAIPRKILASLLTGAGLAMVGIAGHGALDALIFSVLGAALHSFAFGIDPLHHKGMEGIDTFQQDRVAKAVGEAERHLGAMKDAILRAGDRKLEARVDRFQDIARDMFRSIEEDPRDLTSARRYLGVYLLGAKDATAKFADIYARTRDVEARSKYETFLDDLEQNFSAKTKAFLLDDKN